MYVTPIGFLVIPIGFAIFFFRPESLGPLAILLSAFQAASVSAGGAGVYFTTSETNGGLVTYVVVDSAMEGGAPPPVVVHKAVP